MSEENRITYLESFTWLPVQTLIIPNRQTSCIVIETPHAGRQTIELDETTTRLFTTMRSGKNTDKVLEEIKCLEVAAERFLRTQWLNSLQ